MESVRCSWVRVFVVVLLCIAAPRGATAQGTGTLTGTVIDDTGASLPGATVTATDATTATVRSVVSNAVGIFRIAALNPGRYVVKVELPGFKPVTIADVNLLSLENRDLGKVSLALGSIQENLTVIAESTPVQFSDSSRMQTITLEDLTNIQVKGRDMYAMLNLLPGVQDTNLNRDFATWTSASCGAARPPCSGTRTRSSSTCCAGTSNLPRFGTRPTRDLRRTTCKEILSSDKDWRIRR